MIAPWEERERKGSPPLVGGAGLNVDGKGLVNRWCDSLTVQIAAVVGAGGRERSWKLTQVSRRLRRCCEATKAPMGRRKTRVLAGCVSVNREASPGVASSRIATFSTVQARLRSARPPTATCSPRAQSIAFSSVMEFLQRRSPRDSPPALNPSRNFLPSSDSLAVDWQLDTWSKMRDTTFEHLAL